MKGRNGHLIVATLNWKWVVDEMNFEIGSDSEREKV